jgi:hypothetical protein
MEIINEKGKSTSVSGWKRQRTLVNLSNGAANVLKTSAHTTWVYSPTWTKTCTLCSHVDEGEIGFGIDFKHLQKTKTSARIVCFSCNVFKSSPMYQHKQTRISCSPFSPPHERKKKTIKNITLNLSLNVFLFSPFYCFVLRICGIV